MKCRICNSTKIVKIIDLGKQPLANKYPKNIREIKKEKKFNLSIFFCKICHTAQIKNIISRKLMFEEYFYLSSVNKGLRDHFNKLAKKLKKYNFVVDIGSNDGILLEPLKKNKVKGIGIDPSFNVGKIANDKGLKTYIDFFDKRVINKIIKEHSKPDILVASSVVTHLEDPIKFAKNSKFFLKENGILIIEIEYLYNFIKKLEYERFYFDRPFYYSANSINYIFQSFDMSLFDIELINIHGSSLRLYIKNTKVVKKTKRCNEILSKEKKYLNIPTLNKINKKIIKESNSLRNKLSQFKKNGNKIIGYGAPARVSTITNFSKINNKLIDYIIDDSPIKQNRFTPGSHIKILNKNKNIRNNINVVIVFAYEYFKDIKKNFKNINVKFYKPIPFKKIT
tara:strand:+ start:390 stop:1574 length:1185 start_codon:yes stop_codon:yes gene_type:complete